MQQLTAKQQSRIEEILSEMTLEEKIGQMNQESPSIVGGFDVPFEELIRFRKVDLKPGELSEITFEVPKAELGFYDNEGVYRLEDGLFRIYAGSSSRECLMEEIFLSGLKDLLSPAAEML